MRLCFLGTGGSWPTKRRNSISIGITSGPKSILLDCGEGTQRQILSAPISPMRISGVLITHRHGDHLLGLPGLVQTMSLNGREEKLSIIGPSGTRETWEGALKMCPFDSGFDIEVIEASQDDRFDVGGLTVTASLVDHLNPSLAYRICEKDKPGRFNVEKARELGIPEGKLWGQLQRGRLVEFTSPKGSVRILPEQVLGERRSGACIAYSGDTRPCPAMVELSRGVDALIHEATFSEEFRDSASQFHHSTAKEAAKVALDAGARRLYLVHSSPRYAKEDIVETLLREAREIFPESYLPEDLDIFEVIR